jgi:hypothetical protein
MRISCLICAIASLIAMGGGSARAADPADVQRAIGRASSYLLTRAEFWNKDMTDQGLRSLCALALVKAEVPVETPAIAGAVEAVLKRCTGTDGYVAGFHHYYSAGVDATLLVEVGEHMDQPQLYQAQLQLIANYIIYGQLQNGGWDYPDGHGGVFAGDTSVTQYAMLGLWAATRAGIQVPEATFARCIEWHFAGQAEDGGFVYCPGTMLGVDQGRTCLNMTAAGIGSLLIAARHLYPNQADKLFEGVVQDEAAPMPETAEGPAIGGPLELVEVDPEPEVELPTDVRAGVPITEIQASVQRAAGWMGPRFVEFNQANHPGYYYYTVERAASLAHITHIGPHDWYNLCGDYLLRTQAEDGSWAIGLGTPDQDTAFAILFLVKSTGQIVGEPPVIDPPDLAGAGSQNGGRGLPDDLSNVEMVDGKPVVPENLGATSDLLSALANIDEANFAEVQEQVVKEIQIGDRESLIAQKDKLAELAVHDNAEVRRTAIWALGRTGDMSLAKSLITALEDPDVSVNIEANNALCWLSRRPNGFNLSVDPLGELPPGATQDQIDAVLAAWRADAIQQWGSWYLRHRPFADRGDEFEANLRQRLGR